MQEILRKIETNTEYLWMIKQFVLINETAASVYKAVQGGVDMNFFNTYNKYEDGVFGYIKEHRSFMIAMEIYDNFTANDGWDILNEIEDDVIDLTIDEINTIQEKLNSYDVV